MKDPVVTVDGHTYEREAIEDWLQTHDTSPITGELLPAKTVIPNIQLRVQIREFIEQNPSIAECGSGSGGGDESGGSGGGGDGTQRSNPARSRVPKKRPSMSKIMRGLTVDGGARTHSSPVPPPLQSSSSSSTVSASSSQSPLPPPSYVDKISVRQVEFIKGRPIGLDLDDHLCVRSMHSHSQGANQGIARFETIVEINSSPVKSVAELRANMSRIPNNRTMLLTFLAPMVHTLEKGVPFGLSLTEGMIVQGVAPDSQAADRGVLLGSRLVAIDVSRINFIKKVLFIKYFEIDSSIMTILSAP
jgi:hypothetical protein